MIDGVVQRFGRIDILVNSFGNARPKLLVECAQPDLDLLIDGMLKGKLYCTQHAARHMAKQGSGRIINLASSMGLVTMTRRVAYGAAQAGIIGFSNVAAAELGPLGVNVNVICPGATTSRLTADAIRVAKAHLKHPILSATEIATAKSVPEPPDDIATFVAYLCTDAAKSINGQVFHAAGATIGLPDLMRRPHEIWQTTPWTIEQLIAAVPVTLMKGLTNVPPQNR
jgi:NAD(P)-dependent dehydrogenase (short-subunit alcohol dehydrogenase family)